MTRQPYSQLVGYKRWADRNLYEAVGDNMDKLPPDERAIVLRLLDHIHAVDRIFQHHLQGRPHAFKAPQSDKLPDFESLASSAREVDDWYADYVVGLTQEDLAQPVDFVFTNGAPARMRRGEIILHVCLHGTYHRGNAGVVLHRNGVVPGQDRMTDFLDAEVPSDRAGVGNLV